jgi:hypothetical protein
LRSAEATAEGAVTEVAEAIDAARPDNEKHLELLQLNYLDSFSFERGVSLESLEKTVFPFASGRGHKYLMGSASPMSPPSL